jgi:hypothetical protein
MCTNGDKARHDRPESSSDDDDVAEIIDRVGELGSEG